MGDKWALVDTADDGSMFISFFEKNSEIPMRIPATEGKDEALRLHGYTRDSAWEPMTVDIASVTKID
jgi:hypothetical protein